MATPLAKRHVDRARDAIRLTKLVKRLCDNALADEEFMTANQIRCAEILIRKKLPDMPPQTMDGQSLHHALQVVFMPGADPLPAIEGEVVGE
jgi:hypothetical protein